MNKRTMIVCGDSWNSLSIYNEYKSTHWSELLANDLGYNLISLAQPGGSNKVIVLQVITAIEMKPNLIIFGTCGNSSRVEIMGKDYVDNHIVSLKDFNYSGLPNPIVVKNNIDKMITSVPIHLIADKDIRSAYLKTFSSQFANYVDIWCLMFALRLLDISKIPYIMFPAITNQIFNNNYYNIFGNLKNIIINDFQIDWVSKNGTFVDPGYHTLPEFQIHIKNMVMEHIAKNLILSG